VAVFRGHVSFVMSYRIVLAAAAAMLVVACASTRNIRTR
jgi:hypothetical protein